MLWCTDLICKQSSCVHQSLSSFGCGSFQSELACSDWSATACRCGVRRVDLLYVFCADVFAAVSQPSTHFLSNERHISSAAEVSTNSLKSFVKCVHVLAALPCRASYWQASLAIFAAVPVLVLLWRLRQLVQHVAFCCMMQTSVASVFLAAMMQAITQTCFIHCKCFRLLLTYSKTVFQSC